MSISHYSNKYEKTEWGIHTNSPTADLNITNNATIGGTIQVDTVANDDTENRLLVLNTADNVFEYRNVSSLPNPNIFDQDLNTFDPVEFKQVDIDGGDFLLSTFNDSFTRLHQTPAVTTGDKVFEFQTQTDTGAARIDLNNAGNKSSGLKLQTKTTSDGNAFIQYETGTNRWFEGINKTNNEFAIHYSPGHPSDNLYNAANERLTLTNTGNLTVKQLSIDETNLVIDTVDDCTSTFTQTPAPPNGLKTFTFKSTTNSGPVQVEANNTANNGTSHAAISIVTGTDNMTGGGGNTCAIYDNKGGNNFTVGHKKADETFRFNYGADPTDYLETDALTQMTLTNTGNLTIPGGLSSSYIDNGQGNNILYYMNQPVGNINDVIFNTVTSTTSLNGVTVDINSGNTIISSASDSLTDIIQTPAITTGNKDFKFTSNTSDSEVSIFAVNNNSTATAHASLKACAQLTGGNIFTKYLRIGFAQWVSGYQASTTNFRWNYDVTGNDNLDIDANTRMKLTSTGDLTTTGSVNASALLLQTVPLDNTGTKLLVWDSTLKTVEYRDVTSLPAGNPFDQSLNTVDSVEFLQVDINGGNTIINSNNDSLTSITQTPAITTGFKDLAFLSNTSDSAVQLEVININSAATAHASLTLLTDAVAASNSGGNQVIVYKTVGGGGNGWTVGKQKSSESYRFDYKVGDSDFLTNDINTKMSLSNVGVLGLNNDNLVINPSSDSVVLFEQNPAITTGQKQYLFQSNTSDDLAGFFVENMNSSATAHVGMYLRTDRLACLGDGGNQCVIYETCGLDGFTVGHQKSSETYRWNYSTVASSYLVDDTRTQMCLSKTGDLTLGGTASINGDYVTAAAGQLQIQAVGEMQQNLIFDTETIPSAQLRVANHSDQSISFNAGVKGGAWTSASADGNSLINATAGGNITFYTNASTTTGSPISWTNSLAISPTAITSTLPIQKQDNMVQHSTIGPSLFTITLTGTAYDWTSANGALSMASIGPNLTVNDVSGEATLSDWTGSMFAQVSMSFGVRLVAGSNQTFIVKCIGNATAGVASAEFGASEFTLKNSTDFQEISFVSLVIIANTGYYRFTIENITGADNIELSYARAILLK